LVHWVGAALAVIAILFLLAQFNEHAGQISESQFRDAWMRVLAAAFGYFVCGVPLGAIWWLTVRCSGQTEPPAWVCIQVHMASQLGKYLPGNVAHFAARHWMMRNRGSENLGLIAAGLLEALVLVAAAALLAVAVLRPAVQIVLGWAIPPMLELLLVLAGLIAVVAGWRYIRRRGWIDAALPAMQSVWMMLSALIIAAVFFFGMTACFILVSGNFALPDFPTIVPWIAASWMLGFLVPGAPGGIGVREFVLVLGLSPLSGEAPALLDAALFRLVTIGGDALMAGAGLLFLRLEKRSGN